ncbi:MAG: replication initiator protein [Microvirus sp.]|nr:MAG: replication initiator protein [Microvirus sp.]
MQCISPICLKKGQFVPCGKCNFCLQNRRLDWSFRLSQEAKVSQASHFLTLTYNDQQIPVDPINGLTQLSKEDVRLFTKRLRWYNSKVRVGTEWPTIRYYTVGEYGSKTLRPHYHSIMFNLKEEVVNELGNIWGLGTVKVGTVTPASIMYVGKYHLDKFQELPGRQKAFANISNRSGGIGINYLNENVWWHLEHQATYCWSDNKRIPLSRFYREKIFSKGEREYLNIKNAKLALDNYRKTIMELKKVHDYPEAYLEEQIKYTHEFIRTKSKLNDKF